VQPIQLDRIGEVLRALNMAAGTAMLLVEQHVAFALELASRFLVMKQGAIAMTGDTGAPGARANIENQLAL
jgi:urea transport system ATP-binding protein